MNKNAFLLSEGIFRDKAIKDSFGKKGQQEGYVKLP